MVFTVLGIYIFICLLLFVYSTVEFSLLLNYLFRKPKWKKKEFDELPVVTIQLPIYNEVFVVERLINAVSAIDYPLDKLQIQVLDDSTDETSKIARSLVDAYKQEGFDIDYIHRSNRLGFKAGALDAAMDKVKGEFIAIFDADFIPDKNFLMSMIPYFSDEKIGVVQSRWTYLNEDYSFLTKIQTVMLNTHFTVEHAGRNRSGAYINFNGTAGLWRKDCIEDAGGWMSDTLTEDLDLSFRAQLKGWQFVYAIEIESPSELPITFPGYKSQQFRWAKGAAECTRKNMRSLWKCSRSSFWSKWVGTFHLLNSSVFLIVLGFVLLSFPLTYSLQQLGDVTWVNNLLKSFLVTNLLLMLVFIGGNIWKSKKSRIKLWLFPIEFVGFLVINSGISLYMSLGVIEGYLGKKSEFIRTPKFNVLGQSSENVSKYTKVKITPLLIAEVLVLLYGIFQFAYALSVKDAFAIGFSTMFILGFGINVFSSFYYAKN